MVPKTSKLSPNIYCSKLFHCLVTTTVNYACIDYFNYAPLQNALLTLFCNLINLINNRQHKA